MIAVLDSVRQERNPDVRTYHCRMALTGLSIEMCHRGQSVENEVARFILAIPGVTIAWIEPYSIQVKKARCYDWAEIQPQILGLLSCQEGLA